MRRLFFLGAILLAAGPAWAHPSVSVVRDSRGNVYYSDLKQVWRIAPDGAKSIAVQNVHTHELYVDAEDNLYGEHLWYEGDATKKWGHYVWRLSADGKLTHIIPPRAGFRDDYRDFSFVRDRAGNMYWAEREARPIVIRKRAPDGTTADFGAEAGLSDVRWMTATPEGTVYFTDGPDLVRIAPDGKTTRLARGLRERRWSQPLTWFNDTHNLMGVWADARGNVYVAGYGARKVKRVGPDGRVEVVATSPAPWSPTGGLVASNGDLWLLEDGVVGARVRRISPDGNERVY